MGYKIKVWEVLKKLSEFCFVHIKQNAWFPKKKKKNVALGLKKTAQTFKTFVINTEKETDLLQFYTQ